MAALHLGSEGYSTDGTNGKVGIGTSSPACVLDINVPNSGTQMMLALSNSGGGAADVAELDYDATNSPNPLTLSLKHNRPFVVSGGNLGVGITSPGAKLDVGGKVLITDSNNPAAPPYGAVVLYFDGTNLKAKRNDGKASVLSVTWG